MKKIYSFALLAALFTGFVSCQKVEDPQDSEQKEEEGEKPGDKPEETYDLLFSQVVISNVAEGQEFMAEGASSDHKFVAGSNPSSTFPAIWDVENNTIKEFPGDYYNATFHAISDNGVAVGSYQCEMEVPVPDGIDWDPEWGPYIAYLTKGIYTDGEALKTLDVPANAEVCEGYCVSKDGKTIAGFWTEAGFFDDGYHTYPCVWVDGVRQDLPMPTEANVGFATDPMAEVRWMSEDGSVLVGFVQDNATGSWIFTSWKKEGSNYVISTNASDFGYTGADDASTEWDALEAWGVSANGKYVAFAGTSPFVDWDTPQDSYYGVIDLEKNEMTKIKVEVPADMAICNYTPVTVANNGTLLILAELGASPWDMTRYSYVLEAGQTTPKALSEYPGADQISNLLESTPMWMASNCSAICGWGTDASYATVSYILY